MSDCVDVFRHLPAQSVDVIVTSPPYNLGIRYNKYEDSLSQADYLEWTNTWVAAAARVLRPEGSLFLNVGAKPSDPWTALDVAQTVRSHLRLQNIIHWIKSIAIERDLAGAGSRMERDLAVARQIQRSLLPEHPPVVQGYDLAVLNEPCFECGGDYYDFLNLGPQTLLVVIADVEGKGVGSALVSTL